MDSSIASALVALAPYTWAWTCVWHQWWRWILIIKRLIEKDFVTERKPKEAT